MIDQAAAMEMRRILTDPKLMVFLQAQEDEYGTPRLGETLRKIEYGTEVARSFGFDETLTLAIQTIHDLSLPCFGVVGEEFLRAVDPDYTRAVYGRRLAGKLLHGLEPAAVNAVCEGVWYTLNGRHHSPEEMIVWIMQYCFDFSRTLASHGVRILFESRYRQVLIEKSAQAGRLFRYEIPANTIETRPVLQRSAEELQARRARLDAAYRHCLAHPETVPEAFRAGWGDLPEPILLAYYVAGLREDQVGAPAAE